LAALGAISEVGIAALMQRQLPPEVAAAYRAGAPRLLDRAATATAVGGVALTIAGHGKRRAMTRVGGLLVAMGAACERFAIYEAGKASAADPRATVGPQRRRQNSTG
jgi:hypothetical protein